MENQYKEICEKVLTLTKNQGIEQSDIILNTGKALSLKAQQQKIDELKVSSSQVVGVRVIKNNKVGISYSESFDDDALKLMVESAADNASNMETDLFQSVDSAAGEYIIKTKPEEISLDEKIDLTLLLEKNVLAKDKRVKGVPYNGLSESKSSYYYLNSNGTFHYEDDFYYSCFTSALVEEAGRNSMHYHGNIARSLKNIDIDECVSKSLEHAINWLDAKPVSTGNYDLIFTADAFDSVRSVFGMMFSGKAAIEKINPFKDKQGLVITDERLNISDIPKYQDTFFKSTLDSEGYLQNDLVLIENGKLCNFFHSSKTAKELKQEHNFRGVRGARSGLGVAGTTQVWSASGSDQEVISGKYLEIHSLQGLHSGASPISGEFSFGASGYLCEDGKRISPVKGITVSGNYYQMLNNIASFGSETKANSDFSFFAPLIRFKDMSVAGE